CKRLMVKLKQRISVSRQRVVPASGIPLPRDALIVQAVAYCGHSLLWDQLRRVGYVCRMWRVDRERRIDGKPIRSDPRIVQGGGIRIRDGISRRIWPYGRGCGNEENVIQKGSAKCGVKEVVTHDVFLCQLPLGHLTRIKIAEHQSAVVAPRDELVHLSAVDLKLFVIEPVDDISCNLIGRHKL